jgi:hypothetical protein
VTIAHNDDPIQFGSQSRPLVYVNESDGVVVLTVTRGGSAVGTSVVSWRADVVSPVTGVATPLGNGSASVQDTVTFNDGDRLVNVTIPITVDNDPAPNRYFRVTLTPTVPGINAGYVVPSTSITIVTVLANNGQDANGTTIYAGGSFQFASNTTAPLRIQEGDGLWLPIIRVGGAFSNVSLVWQVGLGCVNKFSPNTGSIPFPPGVTSGAIVTLAVDDNTPEQLLSCVFQLTAITYNEPVSR